MTGQVWFLTGSQGLYGEETLQQVAATAPAQPLVNPLEAMVREMLRPVLKEWLDQHLPAIVDEHVKREISRITGQGF